MTEAEREVFLVFVASLWMLNASGADTEVSCVSMESCILPCSFQGGTDVVVHWIQMTAGHLRVHSYYHNQDQLAHQDQRFRGRTSLFKDQISRGNASLQLTGVEVQDEDTYKCHTSIIRGNKDSFINLRVDAPVGKVDLQQVENSITCSSEGIYPEPELTWSTSPPSYVTFKSKTEVQRTEQLLYNISSSLILSDTDLNYICSISTRSNRRRATLFKPTSLSVSHTEATIPCTASNTSLTGFSLTWRFNHSQIILTQTRADVPCTVSEEWRQQVKGVSESGSLLLQHLSSYHEGIYTCELRDAEETLITSTFLRIDIEVSCVFMESCILPCSFQGGTDVVVHWLQLTAGHLCVHSYFKNQDQLAHQDKRFRGRTSLFKDQISRGNASLQLTGVEVQDQGRYRCFTSTNRGNKDSLINLRVDAPVGKVDLQQVENSITCSSEGIYPEPELTWSTSPPSYVTFKNKTEVQRTEQLLYSISSSLILSDTDLNYICSINTRSNRRRATLFKPTSLSGSQTEATIPCTASNTSLTGFSLTWRFKHSQIILTQTRADVPYTVSEEWRQQVKGVSESGSLLLQDLSSYHDGIYTCELRDAEETLITNTFLRVEKSPGNSVNVIVMVVAAVLAPAAAAAAAAAAVVLLVLYRKKKKVCRTVKHKEQINESTPLQNGDIRTYTPLPQSGVDCGHIELTVLKGCGSGDHRQEVETKRAADK